MSSPTKQVSGRRLPPLASTGVSGKSITIPLKSSKLKDVEEREALLAGTAGTSDVTRARNAINQGKKDVTVIEVVEFLGKNPNVLENYVMDSVSKEELERWLIRKIHAQKSLDSKSNSEQSMTSLSRWKFCVHSDKQKTLQYLTQEIHRQPHKAKVMFELVKCISVATHADRFSLYLVSKNEKEIFLYSEENQDRSIQVNQQPIKEGFSVSAYVAATMTGVRVQDILGDERFPSGIGIEDSMALSVICQPIVQSDGKLAGVAEFVRVLGNQPFQPEDEEIATSYLTWGGITIHYAQIFKDMKRQKNLHNFLLDVIKSLFDEMDTVDGVITNVMTYAKRLVDADRCAMFLCDGEHNELHADLFDEGRLDENGFNVFSKGKEIRFTVNKGIAGYVASSGKLLNIKDAYSDPRFNREVDVKTGYTTHTILCVPMKCKDKVVGVVQLINKRKGVFTSADEHAFILFAGYCGLAIRYSQIFTHLFETKQKHRLALDVLSYHCCVSDKIVQKFLNMPPLDTIPDEFWRYSFNMYQDTDLLFKLSIFMSEQIMEQCSTSIDPEILYRFVLTVRKNYRPVSYHNWYHAFSVAHTIFLIFHNCPDTFTVAEKLGFFFGALCHDIDHRGNNNSFLVNIKSPMALLYQTSTLERHHVSHTLYLMQHEELNILKNVEGDTYNEVIDFLGECILATDIAQFPGVYVKLEQIVHKGEFEFKNHEHRSLLRHLMISAADLCAMCKPWNIHRQSVKKICEEFYAQGDYEKEMGITPLALMDRDKKNELPEAEVSFFTGMGVPCYALLHQLLPITEPLLDIARDNLLEWKRLAGYSVEEHEMSREEDIEAFEESLKFAKYS